MVRLNCAPQFAEAVSSGNKRQTIREDTKARAGCVLHLYTGQGTKTSTKLLETVCTSVQSIILTKTLAQPHGNVCIVGMFLEDFAKADGFKDYAEMWAFFAPLADEDGLFHGKLIKW